MQKVIVLGAGMVGRAMAMDMAKDFEVWSADIAQENLDKLSGKNIQTVQADLSNPRTISELVSDKDLVIGAVPGFMGYSMLQTVIEAGKNISDISFFDEDPMTLDALAKEKGVTAVMDVGVAPGMDNIILGYHNQKMQVEKFVCLVGGLPAHPQWPYGYKAPFSPIDVLEEYTRPARIVEGGELVVKPALSEPELMEFDAIGTLEAFNSDGLRSLVYTMPHIPDMIERTLRYPGHIELMRVLRETGFFSKEEMVVHGQRIRPLDLTAKLLFPIWKLQEEEEEFTVMRVIISGTEKGKKITYTYDLLDRYDPVTKISSMSRTTGYTCTGAARLILNGQFSRKGVFPPEFLGEDEANFSFMLRHLQERGIIYKCTES